MSPLSSHTILLILLILFITFSSSALSDDENPIKKSSLLKKKSMLSTKNQTKIAKPKKLTEKLEADGAGDAAIGAVAKVGKSKLNKTMNSVPKVYNSTKLLKPPKLPKSNATKVSKLVTSVAVKTAKLPPSNEAATNPNTTITATKEAKAAKPNTTTTKALLDAAGDEIDLMSDLSDLHSLLLPDLQTLSTSSKSYISAANRGLAHRMKPLVGKSIASKAAPIFSSLSLILPLLLLALLFRRLRSLLSLDRLLVFIQAYLAIYFATLAAAGIATGLDPLRFLYATSPASYTWAQAVQTAAYLVYLVAQLADLVALFGVTRGEPRSEEAARGLGLLQMIVGLGVGVHYYVAVFRRAVSGEAPRANWRVHAVYAVCFVVICACSRAERRKKVYVGDDEGGKIN